MTNALERVHPDELTLIDLTGFQRDALAVIGYRGAPHGLAIKEELSIIYREDINHGRLYPNLDDLVDAGLVEKGKRDLRTNEYTLTDAGRDALAKDAEWRAGAAGGRGDE